MHLIIPIVCVYYDVNKQKGTDELPEEKRQRVDYTVHLTANKYSTQLFKYPSHWHAINLFCVRIRNRNIKMNPVISPLESYFPLND